MFKIAFSLFAGLFLVCGMAAMSLAQEEAGSKEAVMNPEQQEAQERMEAYTTVNVNHAQLKALEGTWNAKIQMWMDPAGAPMESEGQVEAMMIFNGRFLEQQFSGTMMGKPFEGRGIYGYDNLRKEYVSIWFDSMATGIMSGKGQYDSAAKSFNEEGAMSCPITNETHRWQKARTTLIDADHYTYESFMKDKDGKEFKSMVITYSRVK